MKTILVTGPIGSGKSAVCSYLSSKGYEVYDCDSRCKALYDKVPGLKGDIEKALGIKFRDLALVFSDADKLKALENLVYPLLREDILGWKAALSGEVCFVESAIAASKPQFSDLYDGIWLVEASYELRARRNPKASGRDALQSFDSVQAELHIINDSSLENLYKQIPLL